MRLKRAEVSYLPLYVTITSWATRIGGFHIWVEPSTLRPRVPTSCSLQVYISPFLSVMYMVFAYYIMAIHLLSIDFILLVLGVGLYEILSHTFSLVRFSDPVCATRSARPGLRNPEII